MNSLPGTGNRASAYAAGTVSTSVNTIVSSAVPRLLNR